MLLFLYYSRYYNFVTDYIRSQWYTVTWVMVCASMMPDDVMFVILIMFNFIMFIIIMFAAATGTCWSHVSKEGTLSNRRNIWFRLICAIIRQFKAWWIVVSRGPNPSGPARLDGSLVIAAISNTRQFQYYCISQKSSLWATQPELGVVIRRNMVTPTLLLQFMLLFWN